MTALPRMKLHPLQDFGKPEGAVMSGRRPPIKGYFQHCADRGCGEKGQFTTLLHHINADTLRTAFYALKRKAAPGVDGITWQDYEADLEPRIEDLHGRVHRGELDPGFRTIG